MTGAGEATRVHSSNASAWDETAAWYDERARALLDRLRAGGTTLHPQELRLLAGLPPLAEWCRTAVHLQCAGGSDTVSLANLGAHRAIGVDISPRLVEVATATARELGARAEFVCSDVLDYELEGPGADLVYTGKGALHWMFDLRGWASTVVRTLAPGGWVLVFDFHPMMWLFRDGDDGLERNPVSYFAPTITYTEWADSHFAGGGTAPAGEATKRIRPWPPSAVVQALLDQGLEVRLFHEYPDTLSGGWTAYPRATPAERAGVATTYAVMARKPEEAR